MHWHAAGSHNHPLNVNRMRSSSPRVTDQPHHICICISDLPLLLTAFLILLYLYSIVSLTKCKNQNMTSLISQRDYKDTQNEYKRDTNWQQRQHNIHRKWGGNCVFLWLYLILEILTMHCCILFSDGILKVYWSGRIYDTTGIEGENKNAPCNLYWWEVIECSVAL